MKLVIEDIRGFWKADMNGRCEFADTLEELLQKMVPDAPEDYVWKSAEVLGSVLGAECVPTSEIDFSALADAMFNAQDDPEHCESGQECCQCGSLAAADCARTGGRTTVSVRGAAGVLRAGTEAAGGSA